jgi:hypothetical protein
MFESRQAHVDGKSPAFLPKQAGAIRLTEIGPFVTEAELKLTSNCLISHLKY